MGEQMRRAKRGPSVYEMVRGAERGTGPDVWAATEAAQGRGDGDVWGRLREEVDPAAVRPTLADDIEIKEFPLRWGNDYAVIANPRDLIHYKMSPPELAAIRLMDGTRTLKEIVLERFQESGDLELSGMADLVRTLREGGFLTTPFVDVPAAVERARTSMSRARRKLREFGRTLSIDWSGAHRMVAWLYRNCTRWLFTVPAKVIGVLLSIAGVAAFVSLVRGGQYALTGESLALGIVVLLVLDYLMVFVHELGHATVLVHHGRRVRSAGFQIYFGSPAFFVDSTDGLMLDKRYQIWESFAGPYAQMLIGAVASLVALAFPDWVLSETLYRFCAINYLVLTMNLIPLLELDGYWILSDVIQMPELRPRSLSFLQYDLWHKLRRRQRLTRQEVGLLLYGVAGVAFTIFSFYTAFFYWRTVFGDMVAGLWNAGVPTQVLLVVVAVFILGPVVRGALRLVRALVGRVRSVARSVRFHLEQGWRVEAAGLIDALPLFEDLPVDVLNDLAGRVRLRSVDPGQPVVRQGERADAFYVVRRGTLQVVEEDPATSNERALRTLGRGEAFGELGLADAAPRRATVRAVEPAEVFVVDKGTFDRQLADMLHVPEFEPTLAAIAELRDLRPFSHLEPDELHELAERGAWLTVAPDTEVVRQGEPGDAFYAVRTGQAEVIRDGQAVTTLGPGSSFGELALLFDEPRAATVRTITATRLFRLERDGFDRLVADAFRKGTLNPATLMDRAQHH